MTEELQSLQKQLDDLVRINNRKEHALSEQYGAELVDQTVVLARCQLFVDFMLEEVLTNEQRLRFEIRHAQQQQDALTAALRQAKQITSQARQQSLLSGVPGVSMPRPDLRG